MIDVVHLSKKYGNELILNDITVQFEAGKITGLVGANGCGKTTLMRCIIGFSKPTSGYVIVNGCLVGKKSTIVHERDIPIFNQTADFAPSTGMIIEEPGLLPHYSGLRNLLILCGISGGANKQRALDVMRIVGLDPNETKPVAKYSLGMRQRLGIAQAIMENPSVLILDEPFNGLDNNGVSQIHELLQTLKQQGKTILLASHSAVDIGLACDLVYEMRAGRVFLKEVNN